MIKVRISECFKNPPTLPPKKNFNILGGWFDPPSENPATFMFMSLENGEKLVKCLEKLSYRSSLNYKMLFGKNKKN